MGRHGPYEPHILPYLRAHEVQEPILLATAWLWVGHLDEFVHFLPVKSEKGWAVVVADPEAGLQMLHDAQEARHGDASMFSRKTDPRIDGVTAETITDKNYGCLSVPVPEKSINEYLSDPDVATTNTEAGKRIEANIYILRNETGITDADIFHLPMLSTITTATRFPTSVHERRTRSSPVCLYILRLSTEQYSLALEPTSRPYLGG
ncbi:Nn.00g117850.m01.CDS01 [Neocucurbitaria sp. VM-36]